MRSRDATDDAAAYPFRKTRLVVVVVIELQQTHTHFIYTNMCVCVYKCAVILAAWLRDDFFLRRQSMVAYDRQ